MRTGAGRLLAMMDHSEDGGWEVISYDGSQ